MYLDPHRHLWRPKAKTVLSSPPKTSLRDSSLRQHTNQSTASAPSPSARPANPRPPLQPPTPSPVSPLKGIFLLLLPPNQPPHHHHPPTPSSFHLCPPKNGMALDERAERPGTRQALARRRLHRAGPRRARALLGGARPVLRVPGRGRHRGPDREGAGEQGGVRARGGGV